MYTIFLVMLQYVLMLTVFYIITKKKKIHVIDIITELSFKVELGIEVYWGSVRQGYEETYYFVSLLHRYHIRLNRREL